MVAEAVRATDLLDNRLPEIVAWRREIHSHPELDFAVERTAGFVAGKLREFGVDEIVEGVGRTGVVGLIHGRSTGSGRVVGLRADMDALPIVEASGVGWASETRGKMHACGHDGHTAMLLGAAEALAASREFDGTVALIFQPAEEGGGGGREMVEDGMMERFGIDRVFGMHNMPGMPVGHFAIRHGPLMACADQFDITVEGRGGHAAMPHTCIDPVVVSAHLIVALQTIASREVRPTEPVVVTVTTINVDGDAYNVIPQTVHLRGTVRAFSDELREHARRRVTEIAEGLSATFGARACVDYEMGYPPTVNDPAETDFVIGVATRVVGADKVDPDKAPVMGAEDFSYMLNARPGAFIFIGNGETAALHHPAYDFNDEALGAGCRYWIELVAQALPMAV